MSRLLQVVLTLILVLGQCEGLSMDLANRFFKLMNVNSVYLSICSNEPADHIKQLSSYGFQASELHVKNFSIMERQLDTQIRAGIILDFDCEPSREILETASRLKAFHDGRPWIIFVGQAVAADDLQGYFESVKPAMFNVTEFFLIEYDRTVALERMQEINEDINYHVLREIHNEEDMEIDVEFLNVTHLDWLAPLSEIGAFIDSHVLLSVPRSTGVENDLYTIHRKTNHSAMEVERIGDTGDISRALRLLEIPNSVRRQDFHRTIMRAGCGLLYNNYFSRSEDLPPPHLEVDLWSSMTFSVSTLLEEQLNFRMLVKCFDDYGWPINGQFTGMVGFMQRGHAEISATGVVLHNGRMNVIDYVDGLFEFKLGLLLRQPSLGSVANIFVLPFSSSVWAALLALLITTSLIVWSQLKTNQWLASDHRSASVGDVMYFITGVICQRGDHLVVSTVAVRWSMLVVLTFSLFLFTSYAASIVSLLQSPAHFINNLEDFAASSMAIGIEDMPYEKKFLMEDEHEIVKQIYEEKISPEKERAWLNTTAGISALRSGMFAFQCELPTAYKIIGETYTASEKCGLTKLELFPNRIMASSITTKKSPNKEVLNVKLKWLREVGLTNRVMRRWSHSKPACTSAVGGYASLTITHIRHLLYFFTYGLGMALVFFFVEVFLHLIKKKRLTVVNKNTVLFHKTGRVGWERPSPFDYVR